MTFFGLFLTPVFYVALRWLSLRGAPRPLVFAAPGAGGPVAEAKPTQAPPA